MPLSLGGRKLLLPAAKSALFNTRLEMGLGESCFWFEAFLPTSDTSSRMLFQARLALAQGNGALPGLGRGFSCTSNLFVVDRDSQVRITFVLGRQSWECPSGNIAGNHMALPK